MGTHSNKAPAHATPMIAGRVKKLWPSLSPLPSLFVPPVELSDVPESGVGAGVAPAAPVIGCNVTDGFGCAVGLCVEGKVDIVEGGKVGPMVAPSGAGAGVCDVGVSDGSDVVDGADVGTSVCDGTGDGVGVTVGELEGGLLGELVGAVVLAMDAAGSGEGCAVGEGDG